MNLENLRSQIPTILEKRERESTNCACAYDGGQTICPWEGRVIQRDMLVEQSSYVFIKQPWFFLFFSWLAFRMKFLSI